MTEPPARPLRALFVNENLGGHATMHLAIESETRPLPEIDASFLHVARAGIARRAVAAEIPGLARLDADLQPLRNQLAQSWWVRRRLGAHLARCDVVHAYTQNTVLLSPKQLRSVPSVVSTDSTVDQHASMLPYRDPGRGTPQRVRVSRRLEQRVYDAATLVVAQSEWAAQSLRDTYGVPPDKLQVIPFGITMPVPPPRVEPDPQQVTFIGHSMRRKGGFRILEMYRDALSDRCTLNIVTPERIPAQPGVTVFNDFTPGDPRLRELLARSSILLFPSEIDTFGYAVVEAMAAGTAVVATGLAALPEIVSDGETGLLVAPGADDRTFVHAIRTLLDDPERRRRMGLAGQARATERFDAHRTTGQLIAVLRNAVERFEAPRRPV